MSAFVDPPTETDGPGDEKQKAHASENDGR